MQWQKFRLGEICEIYDCPHTTAPDEGEGYALVRTPNVGKGRLIFDKMHRVCKEVYDRRNKRAVPRAGDIIFAREAPAGNAALITEGQEVCLGQRTVLLRPNHKIADSAFLTYCIISPKVQERLLGISHGSTVSHVNMPDIVNLEVPLPTLSTQYAIGKKLSQYDQLIENNTRRIAILEAKAEQLYKEWFVRRQSPEHSATTGVTLSLGDAIKISRGLSYTSSEIDTDAGVQLINLKNIQPYGGFRYDGTKRFSGKYKPDQIVVRGDLVMGVTDMTQDRRAVGSVALMPPLKETSVISADLIKIEPKIDKLFLYAMLRYGGLSRYISQFANGANVLHLRPQSIMGIKVQLPSKEFIERFSARLRPMIALADNLNEQNALLAKERDLLLPRLMSGRLSCAAHESAPSQEEALP